mgnify:CR=1 FL=1
MKLCFDAYGQVYLEAKEANGEPDYWKSKLAFGVSEAQKQGERRKEKIWEIKPWGQWVKVDLAGKRIYFPENASSQELCYALRVMIDTIQLLEKRLPFHAAGIGYRNHCALIFADSGQGKSYLAHLLCGSDQHCRIIGDDHIYLLPGRIQGNGMCRLRDEKGTTAEYIKNEGVSIAENIVGICFSKAEENAAYEIPHSQWYEWLAHSDALKYAGSPFRMQGREYRAGELFGCDIEGLYQRALKDGAVQKLFLVKGTHDYAVDSIRKYMQDTF